MTTAVKLDAVQATSPRKLARIIGLLYLVTIVTGIIAQGVISGKLITSDAATTAANILANQSLYRLGFAVYLIEMACQIAMTSLLYNLLKPVNRSVALLTAIFGLTGCVIKTLSRLFYYAPLLVLGGGHYLSVFNTQQLQSLAMLFIKVNDQGAGLALAFFGVHTVMRGWLVIKSTFLPAWLGVLSILGGAGWLAFAWPPLGNQLLPYIALIGLVGSIANIGWFLIKGVDEERWRDQATLTRHASI